MTLLSAAETETFNLPESIETNAPFAHQKQSEAASLKLKYAESQK